MMFLTPQVLFSMADPPLLAHTLGLPYSKQARVKSPSSSLFGIAWKPKVLPPLPACALLVVAVGPALANPLTHAPYTSVRLASNSCRVILLLCTGETFWARFAPDAAMAYNASAGRDSQIQFKHRTCQTLARPEDHPDTHLMGELHLHLHLPHPGATAYHPDHRSTGGTFKLPRVGIPGVSLSLEPKSLPTALVRRSGLSALTGHYLNEVTPTFHG